MNLKTIHGLFLCFFIKAVKKDNAVIERLEKLLYNGINDLKEIKILLRQITKERDGREDIDYG